MSSRPHWAKIATDVLADEHQRAKPPSSAATDAMLGAIADAISATHAQKKKRRLGLLLGGAGLAAAAAAVVLVVTKPGSSPLVPAAPVASLARGGASELTAVGHVLDGGVVLLRRGEELALALPQGTGVVEGDRIVTASTGRASIGVSNGSHLVVEGGADVVIAEQGATLRYALRAGAMRADVAKLREGQRFVIGTGDAEVEVRGTSFRVAVVTPSSSCGGGTSTRVSVTEGVVVVRANGHEDRVAAGEEWPRGCEAMPLPENTLEAPSPLPSSRKTPAPAATKADKSSTLAEENDLFAQATSAKRRGDVGAAIAGFDGFLGRYPASGLAESAFVERMRLLAATDRGRAAEAARTYLARYPRGFARAEASALAGTKP